MKKSNNNPSDTPETDRAAMLAMDDAGCITRMEPIWETMERLERERNEAVSLLRELKREMEWCLDWAPDDSKAKAKRIMKRILPHNAGIDNPAEK